MYKIKNSYAKLIQLLSLINYGYPWIIPLLIFLYFLWFYSVSTILRHLTYNSHAFDLGIYTQTTYLYTQGTMYSTLKLSPLLADHFEPILYLFSLLVNKMLSTPILLLIIQSLFVSLSSIFIYLISQKKLNDTVLSILITIVYLTSAGLVTAINFDFHTTTISVLPLSVILYAWIFKKQKLYWLALFFSILFKEDIPIFILGLGLYQVFNSQKKIGLASIIFAATSFYTIKFVIMPAILPGAEKGYLNTSILPLDSPIDLFLLFLYQPTIIFDQIFNSPVKLQTIDSLLRPFGFTAILSPLTWFTVLPYLFLRFSSNYVQMWTMHFHHNANLIPLIAVSTILVISNYGSAKKLVKLLLIFLLMTGGLSLYNPVWRPFHFNFKAQSKYTYINQSLSELPIDAHISAQSPIVPHIAEREKIYMYPVVMDAQYIVLDKTLSIYPYSSQEEFNQAIEKLEKSSDWKIKKRFKSLLIFEKVPKVLLLYIL